MTPRATAKALRDVWLWTDDMGSLDAHGFPTLRDCSKDMIISSVSNIYPREVGADQFVGDRVAGVADLLREKQPSQHMSQPSRIGEVAAMVFHPRARTINSVTFPMDGDWTAQ